MSEIIEITDVSDGGAVADAISLFVNSYTCPIKVFCIEMKNKDENLKKRFTSLCIAWFLSLATVRDFDRRNEASVMFARKLSCIFTEPMPREKRMVSDEVQSFEFDFQSGESAANLLEQFFKHSDNSGAFVEKMLGEHKTLQQSFSRLCGEWFKTAAGLQGNSSYIKDAIQAERVYSGMPLV